MEKRYNDNPITLTEAKIFIGGKEIFDGVKAEIKFTPDVWTGKVLGERSPSSRWMGFTITGTITRRRSTQWLKEIIQQYQNDGVTPEFTIQGVMDDKGSDYYTEFGSDTVTAVGCVLTGDIMAFSADTAGGVVEDAVAFNAKDVIMG